MRWERLDWVGQVEREKRMKVNNTEIHLSLEEAKEITLENFGGYMGAGYHLRHAVGDYLKQHPKGKGIKSLLQKIDYCAARIYWKQITTPKCYRK